MRESELIKQKSIKERLDSVEREKYYCNKCKKNHYINSKIGKKHQSVIKFVDLSKKPIKKEKWRVM